MPSSVVQRVLLKICEERREVSGGLSDFIISDRAHRWSGAGEGRLAGHGAGDAEASGAADTESRCSSVLGSLTESRLAVCNLVQISESLNPRHSSQTTNTHRSPSFTLSP